MAKALVFGAGLSGLGAKYLLEKNDYKVYLVDDKTGIASIEAIEILENEKIEFVVKSPGIPWTAQLLIKAIEKNIKIISEIDLAYKYMDKSIKVISFTGTNGKTTTANKMVELLEYAGYRVRLAGNAGYSFARLVADDDTSLDYVVLELSSYQLENNPQIKSYIAGIINLTPDHLTRYNSVEEYYKTKFDIFTNQEKEDYAIINLDDENFLNLYNNDNSLKQKIKANKIYISQKTKAQVFVRDEYICTAKNDIKNSNNLSDINEYDKIINLKDLSLKGKHNLENILYLVATAKILSLNIDKVVSFLKNTKALEHRLEDFFVIENTTFINDSKGTNVESTIKAIDSYNNEIILILGGDDKKINNDELVQKIKEKVSFVYLIGENAPILEKDMDKIDYKKYKNLETIENVLKHLNENEDFSKNKTILFSPATSSFCQFKNFEHRGEMFKQLTKNIIGKNNKYY